MMTCLCDKLRAENYSDITEHEADILKGVLEKAPHLFKARRPTRPSFSGPEVRFEAAYSCATKSTQKPPRSSSESISRTRKRRLQISHTPSSQVQLPARTIQDTPEQQPSEALWSIVRSAACVNRNTAVKQNITIVAELEKSYRCQNIEGILNENGGDLRIQGSDNPSDVIVDIVLAIERSDQIIEIKQLWKRIYCYALAKLHPKGTSVDNIVQRVQDTLGNVPNIKTKVYQYLRLGERWGTLIDLFESVCRDAIFRDCISQPSQIQLTGILCVLGTGSLWERTPIEDCRTALVSLCAKTDIYERVVTCSPATNGTLRKILDANSFIHSSNSQILWSNPKPHNSRNSIAKSICTSRGFHAASGTLSHWKGPSLVAAYEAFPGMGGTYSEDAGLLLVLLCFLANSEVSLYLPFRGANPRRRWDEHGEIGETDALCSGLHSELVHLLSNIVKLGNALDELVSLSVISRNADQTYMVDQAVVTRVSDSLPPELHSFWRLQALVVAYRSIPWKYLEPEPSLIRKLFIPHLQHTLREVRHHDGFQQLAADTRTDLTLTLIEASRFPNTQWKRFAIDQAKEVMGTLNDEYLRSCIAQRECLLFRIAGELDQAVHALANVSGQSQLEVGTDKRMQAGLGQTVIQRALNHVQVDELTMANKVLDAWRPLYEIPSRIEEVVLFRKLLILGKISRYQGNFQDSLAYLERSKNTADQRRDLFFDEDRCDLICNLADTLLELDNPVKAEHCLRTEIARQGSDRSFAVRLLKLALSESLFAREKYSQAEALSLEVQSCPSLSKMEKLRLSITRAKLCHVKSDLEGAFRHWTEAILVVGRFTMTSGHTTRTILLSICDILRQQGCHELELQSRGQFDALGKMAGPAGAMYWIAGLRH